MKHVLFVCIHNSARSQMAQAYANSMFGEVMIAQSAGIESGSLNPLAVQVMKEDGIDISNAVPKTVDEYLATSPEIDTVITVCDDASAERCPFIPGAMERIHWSFPDPSSLNGTHEENLTAARKIRDDIKHQISTWFAEMKVAQT